MRGVLSSRGSASGTGPGPMDHGYNRCDGYDMVGIGVKNVTWLG